MTAAKLAQSTRLSKTLIFDAIARGVLTSVNEGNRNKTTWVRLVENCIDDCGPSELSVG